MTLPHEMLHAAFAASAATTNPSCYSNPANQRTRRHQANYTQQTNGYVKPANTAGAPTKRHGPECFHCKGPHVLNKCPQATEEQKEQLHRKHLGPRANRKNDRDRGSSRRTSAPSSSSHQANQAAQRPTATEEQANTARVINTGRPSRTGVTWARGYFAAAVEDLDQLSDDEDSIPPLVQRAHDYSSSDDDSDDEDSVPPLVYRPHEDSSSDDDSDDEESSMPDLSRRQFYDSSSDDESDYEDSLSPDDFEDPWTVSLHEEMETLLRVEAFSTETPSPVNQDHKTLRCTFRKKTPTNAPKFKT
jgi:hypothetical protein